MRELCRLTLVCCSLQQCLGQEEGSAHPDTAGRPAEYSVWGPLDLIASHADDLFCTSLSLALRLEISWAWLGMWEGRCVPLIYMDTYISVIKVNVSARVKCLPLGPTLQYKQMTEVWVQCAPTALAGGGGWWVPACEPFKTISALLYDSWFSRMRALLVFKCFQCFGGSSLQWRS